MAYNVSQGVFKNGDVIEAVDFTHEFGYVAAEFGRVIKVLTSKITQVAQDSRQFTLDTAATHDVDGGSF